MQISPGTMRTLCNQASNGMFSAIAAILLSLGLGEVFQTYAGNPNGNVTPDAVGQWCRDTTNSVWYRSHGLTNTSWATMQVGGVGKIVNLTAATLTLSAALHDGKIVTVNRAAGSTITLPAASGTGARYNIYVGTTITSNNLIVQVANAQDYMRGRAIECNDTDSSMNGWDTLNTGVVATEYDTITLNGTTKGGIAGDTLEFVDMGANLWQATCLITGTGTEATPWSAAV